MSAEPGLSQGVPARWRAQIDANHGKWQYWVRCALGEVNYGLGRLAAFLAPDLARVNGIVLVCLGNINRRAFAEQVTRLQCMNTCSLEHHRTTPIPRWEQRPGDLLMVMHIRHARRLVEQGFSRRHISLLGQFASPRRGHLHDPHNLLDAYYRSCFILIRSAVEGLIEALAAHSSAAGGR